MSDNNDDLTFSSEATLTRAVLYHGLNDINLFVEDANRQFEYETIFKRLLGEKYCIKTIFAVGGKPEVKKSYGEFGANYHGVRNFYIVDGDFDRYIACEREKMIEDDCFIYLKPYNIENYYIDEQACLLYAKGFLKQPDDIVRQTIDFPAWKNQIVSEAKKLFLCYCLVKTVSPKEKNVSRSPYEFIDGRTGFERTDGAFDIYLNHVKSLTENYDDCIQAIVSLYEAENGSDYFNLICGKFLLTSLMCHIRNKTGQKFKIDNLKWFLTNQFDIVRLNYIKERILT